MRFYLPLTRRSRVSVGPLGMAVIALVYVFWVPLMAMLWLLVMSVVLIVRLIAWLAVQSGEAYRTRQKAQPPKSGI